MTVPAVGRLSYGGVTFGPYFRSKLQSTPLWDAADRTVVAVQHRLDVVGYVGGDGAQTTDAEMQSWHNTLETPGLELHYDQGRGWGGHDGEGLHVNGAAGPKDVAFGPKPRSVTFAPLGGGVGLGTVSAAVSWSVETVLPMCSDANFFGIPAEFNFIWSHEIDGDGLSRVRVNGHLIIPMTRQAGRSFLPDCADLYREKLKSTVPLGYQRGPQNYTLSLDKRRIDFSWTDTQLPTALPKHVTRITCEHSCHWSLDHAAMFTCSLNGSVTIAPDVQKSTALKVWQGIVASRLFQAAEQRAAMLRAIAQKKAPAGAVPVSILLDSVDIREEVFGLTTSFSTTYRLIGATLPDVLAISGLFTAVKAEGKDLSHEEWAATMANSAHHIRGVGKVKLDKDADRIIDLCKKTELNAVFEIQQAVLKAQQPVEAVLQVVDRDQIIKGWGANRNVDPAGSWIAFHNFVTVVEDDRIAIHKPLTGAVTTKAAPVEDDSPNKPAWVAQNPPGTDTGADSSVPDILQRISAPTYKVVMTGAALRLGYHVPEPRLKTVGGVPATQLRESVSEGVLAAVAGTPIAFKRWVIEYALPTTPKGPIETPSNPALQTDAG